MQEQLSDSGFENRPRYTLGEILKSLNDNPSNAICHILSNEDGTYSLMYHIVCEWCDYCGSQGDCRDIFAINRIVPAKENPYEEVHKEEKQFLKEDFFWCYWFYDWVSKQAYGLSFKYNTNGWCDLVNDRHCMYCGQEIPPYGCECKIN